MAPKRSSSASASTSKSSSAAKKSKKASSLQQSTLSFSRGKGATTGPSSSKSKKAVSSTKPTSTQASIDLSSDDDDELELAEHPSQVEHADVHVEEAAPEPKIELKELDPKSRQWDSGYNVAKKMMGAVEPIHADDHSKVDTILRIFDLDFRFGPCTSISRLDRWNRAERLGLEPPAHVKEILTTKQASSEQRLRESVLYGAI